jgi:peptide/nickel transport system permease protein
MVQMIPSMFVILTVIFALTYLMPGDSLGVILGEEMNRLPPERLAAVREELGLNKSFIEQYVSYMGDMLRFDLGRSYILQQDVIDVIGYRLPRTLQLMAGGMLVAIVIGVPAGVIAAIKQYTWIDHTLMILALIGVSMPVFWQGLLAQLLLTQDKYGIALFPVAGYGNGNLYYLVLPSLVLGTSLSATIARVARASMLEVKGLDYLRTAQAKGLRSRTILIRHHLRNALIPVVTVIGLQVAGLMTGALLTETIFNWPGLGRSIVPAIRTRDTPIIMGILVLGTIVFLVVNLITDLIYALLDPRIRYN